MSSIESLSPRLMGIILQKLTEETGTKALVNRADLPVVMKYARTLGSTSKKMSSLVNHQRATRFFLDALSNKFGESREDCAAKLNTVGARQFLWKYIQKNGDVKAYQFIQEIHAIVGEILREAKCCDSYDLPDPMPQPMSLQTKQGLILTIDMLGRPKDIATPFGSIQLHDCGGYYGHTNYSISETLIQRLGAQFESLTCEEWDTKGPFLEIEATKGLDKRREITEKHVKLISKRRLRERKGTQNLITNGDSSTYHIREANGKKTPEVALFDDSESYRSMRLISTIWEMVVLNGNGLDPIPVMPEIWIASHPEKLVSALTSTADIAKWAAHFIQVLENKPVSKGTKSLELSNYSTALVLSTLNAAASGYLPEGVNDLQITAKEQIFLNPGIVLEVIPGQKRSDLKVLQTAYEQVLEKIGGNWQKAELKNHPFLTNMYSEEDHVLFIKPETDFYDEITLIANLNPLLGSWIAHIGHYDILSYYAWIDKKNLENAMRILNIRS